MQARSRVRESTVARMPLSEEDIRARDERTIARALRILERRARDLGPLLGDPTTCGAFFRLRLGNETREHFEVAFLDTHHRLIAVERLFSGSVDGAEAVSYTHLDVYKRQPVTRWDVQRNPHQEFLSYGINVK